VLCFGDTLVLKNGDTVDGTYLGGTTRVLRMEVNGKVQTFDISMVTSLQFTTPPAAAVAASVPPPAVDDRPVRSTPPPQRSVDSYPSSSDRPVLRRAPGSDGDNASSASSNSSGSASAPPPPANTDPDRPILRRADPPATTASAGANSDARGTQDPYNNTPMPTAPTPPPPVELPAGTRITVRMIDSVDSQVARVGDTFRASVDEPVSMNGVTVIPRGADVVAKLVEEDQSGKISGRTTMKLVLSTVRVNDRNIDITTSDVVKQSSSRGARSAGAIGGGAVLGAIIGAAAGGGTGAAIGAGAGAAAGTGVEAVSKGQRVKVPSETRLDFTLSYSVRI
jgi:type IV secretory pathway VirB10-like protein